MSQAQQGESIGEARTPGDARRARQRLDRSEGHAPSEPATEESNQRVPQRLAETQAEQAVTRSGPGESELPTTGSNATEYQVGPDANALSDRHDLDVQTRGDAQRLQRLEATYGADQVSGWAREGMPVAAMGKPQDMQAFRDRQETRPDAVPVDIERRNESSVQRSSNASRDTSPAGDGGVPERVRSVVSSPGASLEEPVQRDMAAHLGDEFSDVRIHTGPDAAAAADDIGARAFTVGSHVAFNDGEYDPGSSDGRAVLAHELTHVRQQTGGQLSMLPKADTALVIDPDPKAEKEAERVADRVTAEDDRTVQRFGTEIHVQRLPDADVASASAGSGPTLAVQRDAAAESSESDGANNIATHHDVSKGDTLSGIADTHDLDDWRSLWYQNYDEIGDVPNMIFPTQTLAVPEDADAVPDLGIEPEDSEFAPAPTRDLREEGADAQPPDVRRGDEADVEASDSESRAEEPVGAAEEADPGAEGAGGMSIAAHARPQTDEPPASEIDAPGSTREDQAFQEGHQEVVSEVGTTVDQDVTGGKGERLSPHHADNAQAASETPDEEVEGAAGEQQLGGAQEAVDESESFDLEGFRETFKQRIDAVTPETMEAIEEFEDDEPLAETEEEIEGDIDAEHESTAGGVEGTMAEEPDTSAVEPEEPEELDRPDAGSEPELDEEGVGQSLATKPRSHEEVYTPFEETQEELRRPREESGVGDEEGELTESPNDEWREAGEERQAVEEACEVAPAEYRDVEAGIQHEAREAAVMSVDESTGQVHEERDQTLGAIATQKKEAKEADETARRTIWDEIQTIYEETDETVSENLETMEEAEEDAIDALSARREEFESEVSQIADDASGWFSAIKDFFTGDDFMDDFEDARDSFIADVEDDILDPLIDTVGESMENIETALADARESIDEKKEELKEQRDDICEETFAEIDAAFDDLDASATAQTEQLTDNVVDTYEEELAAADEHLAEKKQEVEESRKGPISKLKGVWEDIKAIWDMMKSLMSKAGEIVSALVPLTEAPWKEIGSNVVDFFKDSGERIADNWKGYLFDGLMQWLDLDMMRDAEIEVPEDGFDGIGEFGGFLFDIGKALMGGLFDYVLGRAKKAWEGSEIELGPGGLGLTDEQIKESSLIQDKDVEKQGGKKVISIAVVIKILWETGKKLVDWVTDLDKPFETLVAVVKGEERWSALLDHDAFQTVIKPFEVAMNMAVNAGKELIFEGAIKKLKALLGPVGAIIKAAKMLYDLVMFVINNAVGMASVLKGYVDAVRGLVVTMDPSKAVDILDSLIPTFVATLISFLARLAGVAGKASDKVTDTIVDLKAKADEAIDNFLLSKQAFVANKAPKWFGRVVRASDKLGEISSGKGEGSGETTDEEAPAADGATTAGQEGATAERSPEEAAAGAGHGERTAQERGPSTEWEQLGRRADQIADQGSKALKKIEGFSAIDASWDEVADKHRIEEKMAATDTTVAAQNGEVSDTAAAHVLDVSDLEHLRAEAGAAAPAFVTAHAEPIRTGLVRQLAQVLDKPVAQVWDEGSKSWEYEHETMSVEYTRTRAQQAYEAVGADVAGFAGARAGERYIGDDTLGGKMERLAAEQELRARERRRIQADPEWQGIDGEWANRVAYSEDLAEVEANVGASVDQVAQDPEFEYLSESEQRRQALRERMEKTDEKLREIGGHAEQVRSNLAASVQDLEDAAVGRDRRREREILDVLESDSPDVDAEIDALFEKWDTEDQGYLQEIKYETDWVEGITERAMDAAASRFQEEVGDLAEALDAAESLEAEYAPGFVDAQLLWWVDEIVEGATGEAIDEEMRERLVELVFELPGPHDERCAELLLAEYDIDIRQDVWGVA